MNTTDTEARREAAAALRQLATLLEETDLPLPSLNPSWHLRDSDDQREQAAHIRRLVGGEWRKGGVGDLFWMEGSLGALAVTIYAERDQVCTRRVVGTETVTVPAVEAQPERTETREVIEWDCEPVTRTTEAVTSR